MSHEKIFILKNHDVINPNQRKQQLSPMMWLNRTCHNNCGSQSNKDNLEYTPVELPRIVKQKLLELMRNLDLSFGGIDFALVGDVYYFIEINPTGEWG